MIISRAWQGGQVAAPLHNRVTLRLGQEWSTNLITVSRNNVRSFSYNLILLMIWLTLLLEICPHQIALKQPRLLSSGVGSTRCGLPVITGAGADAAVPLVMSDLSSKAISLGAHLIWVILHICNLLVQLSSWVFQHRWEKKLQLVRWDSTWSVLPLGDTCCDWAQITVILIDCRCIEIWMPKVSWFHLMNFLAYPARLSRNRVSFTCKYDSTSLLQWRQNLIQVMRWVNTQTSWRLIRLRGTIPWSLQEPEDRIECIRHHGCWALSHWLSLYCWSTSFIMCWVSVLYQIGTVPHGFESLQCGYFWCQVLHPWLLGTQHKPLKQVICAQSWACVWALKSTLTLEIVPCKSSSVVLILKLFSGIHLQLWISSRWSKEHILHSTQPLIVTLNLIHQ